MRILRLVFVVSLSLGCGTLPLQAGTPRPSPADGVAPAAKAAGATEGGESSAPESAPSFPPKVVYEKGQLSIDAENCSVSEILDAVHAQTGATIEASSLTADARVVVHLGPGDPLRVLAGLLDDSGVNYILEGGSGLEAARIILIPLPGLEPEVSEETALAVPAAQTSDVSVPEAPQTAAEQQLPNVTEEGSGAENGKEAGSVNTTEEKAITTAAQDPASLPGEGTATAAATETGKPAGDAAAAVPGNDVAETPGSDAAKGSGDVAAAAPGSDAAKATGEVAAATGNEGATLRGNDASSAPGDPAAASTGNDGSNAPASEVAAAGKNAPAAPGNDDANVAGEGAATAAEEVAATPPADDAVPAAGDGAAQTLEAAGLPGLSGYVPDQQVDRLGAATSASSSAPSDTSRNVAAVVVSNPFSGDLSGSDSEDNSIPNPAANQNSSASHGGQSGQTNSGNGTTSNTAASTNGGSLSIPGIPQSVLDEICEYYGGTCPEVQQKLQNTTPPPATPICPRIVINPVTQGAGCAN